MREPETPSPQSHELVTLSFAEQRTIMLINGGIDLAHHVLRVGMYLGLGYFLWRSLQELAGKETTAAFLVEWLTSPEKSGSTVVPYVVLSLLFFGWALLERRLRRRAIARMGGRIADLEREIDPARTSSGLTHDGQTPKTPLSRWSAP